MEAFIAVREIVRRAIMTLMAIKDPDERYLHSNSAWCFAVVRDAREAYGYGTASVARFQPSSHDISQMETVAVWLAWLRRTEGEGALRRIIAWTMGVPVWRLGQREKCSERTIRNRIDRSIAAIIRQFAHADLTVEIVEEPIKSLPAESVREGRPNSPFGLFLEKPHGPHGAVILRKVYVYDIGFMIGGKRWRDGREKVDKLVA